MILDRMNAVVSCKPLLDTAWTILEAANDLGDRVTVEVCRRIIDTTLRGGTPAQSDMNVVLDFFK
jgi:hypothetical protein